MANHTELFFSKISPEPNSGCWLWVGNATPSGYGVSWSGKTMRAHRHSWEIHVGPIPANKIICHKCDNRLCVNPDHLFLGTNKENTADAWRKGRMKRFLGEAHGQAKFVNADVLDIRASGDSVISLAKKYGVNSETIYNILKRKPWVHL